MRTLVQPCWRKNISAKREIRSDSDSVAGTKERAQRRKVVFSEAVDAIPVTLVTVHKPTAGYRQLAMRLALSLFRTLLTGVVGVGLTILFAPLVIIIARFNPRSPLIERLAWIWSKAWLLAAGSSIEIRGQENVDLGQTYVVVANHLSILDIMASFLAVPLPIRFLAKKELFKVPILAPAMRSIGIVEVDRQARSAIHERVNQQARSLVENGRSLIIYPEGTRARDGKLRPFKKGAFTMAVAGQIPILPVTIHGTYEAWPPGRRLVRGGKITVVVDPPIPTLGRGKEDVTKLTDEARAVVAKRLEELAAEATEGAT
ncbi:MAG TPA: lysophospholipid acyltransferase family protein [Acidimicrobiia bacterium]|nr:lysophospholipid acyltransferase family protein [Acidimicrobiia bacterium]